MSLLLFDASISDVEDRLVGAGFGRSTADSGGWTFPHGDAAVLFVTCGPYPIESPSPDEERELFGLTEGRRPLVEIMADVSGRVDGDREVLHLVESLLAAFDGVALDDFTYPQHLWRLDEILAGHRVDGLRFFDYDGYYRRTANSAV